MKRTRNSAVQRFVDIEARVADSDEEDEEDEAIYGAFLGPILLYSTNSCKFR